MTSVFVIRGFGEKTDSKGNAIDFEQVHEQLIAPAMAQCNLTGGTTAIMEDAGNIRSDMFELIIQADLVICDITVHNANVFYELGIRHSLRKKHTVLIKGSPSVDRTPFDLSTDRYLEYEIAKPAATVEKLVSTITQTLATIRDTDSPVFLLLPTLSEANPAEITVTPIDLIEEIERAEAVSDVALLRVIAEDLTGERFEHEGLRRVGDSQWSLKDWRGARHTWERIKDAIPNDFKANSALANIYERQYRETGRADLLERSNHAIQTVLKSGQCTIAQTAEALALEGRNLKTLWRADVCNAADVAAARRCALDAKTLRSYEAYRKAFECDLNAYFPGLAALQMGRILQLLTEELGWSYLFAGDERQARRYREDLDHDLPAMTHVVRAAIRRAQSGTDNDASDWARVSAADLLFLTDYTDDVEKDTAMLVQAYQNAIPSNRRFMWDACIGQLQLFQCLGINPAAAHAVLEASDAEPQVSIKEHLVVFSGHTPDTAGRSRRFPAHAEDSARQLIRDALATLQKEQEEEAALTVLASAAPGADILVHEVCAELALATRLCLPLPSEAMAAGVFADADEWRRRFFDVRDSNLDTTLLMSEHAELPGWLKGRKDADLWERGNRWVMQLAQTWGASRVTLLAFWDGQDTDRKGGTAQFVKMGRELGTFDIRIINCQDLL